MKLDIKNFHGERLRGVLHTPRKKTGKVVILCHGRFGGKDKDFIGPLSKKISLSGLNAYRFDFSGNGKSNGRIEDSTVSKCIEDIEAVCQALQNMDYEIFALVGHSKGAVEVLLHQSEYGRAKVVVDIAGTVPQEYQLRFSKKQITSLFKKGYFYIGHKPHFKVSRHYFIDRLAYGDIRRVVRYIDSPVLIVHGTKDKDTPLRFAWEMSKSIKNSEVKIISNADHCFTANLSELLGVVTNWLILKSH